MNLKFENIKNSNIEGFSLVSVLGFFLIVSAFLISFSTSARVKMLTANNRFKSLQYESLSHTISMHIAKVVFISNKNENFFKNIKIITCQSKDFLLRIRLQNHAGLIDLNSASIELLAIGYQSLGFSKKKADDLAQLTDNYRRITQNIELNSQDDSLTDFGYKQGAFENVIELQEFSDLRSFKPVDLSSVFTVLSYTGTISRDVISPKIYFFMKDNIDKIAFIVPSSLPRAVTVFVDIFNHGRLISTTAENFSIIGDEIVYVSSIPVSNSKEENFINDFSNESCFSVFPSFIIEKMDSVLK